MPKVPIMMPQLGESIAEATIVQLGIAVGDTVEVDQEVIEVETNKAAMGVTTMCGGTVVRVSPTGVGSEAMIADITARAVRPWKGASPVSISYRTQPIA